MPSARDTRSLCSRDAASARTPGNHGLPAHSARACSKDTSCSLGPADNPLVRRAARIGRADGLKTQDPDLVHTVPSTARRRSPLASQSTSTPGEEGPVSTTLSWVPVFSWSLDQVVHTRMHARSLQ